MTVWSPVWKLTVDGVDYTNISISDIQHQAGRDDIYLQPAPSYVQITLVALNGQTLPLYGRRLATRSDRYNYYTRTDTYNPVPIPVMFKGRDCQDSVGCEEIFNGDKVLTGAGTEGKVSVYQFDGPPYIPYI